LSLPQIAEAIRDMLREECWCRLESSDAFVHLGYDYYMYLGVPKDCPNAVAFASANGLFVEPFKSPYKSLG
jgi:TPR repeat protein